MGLNKSIANMYEFCTHTWNPIRGCLFDCPYCYVKNLIKRYGYDNSLRLVEKELKTKLGEGKIIFVGSTCDMWGDWVSDDQINRVLNHCLEYPKNQYIFQSKNPRRFLWFTHLFEPVKNFLIGTTIETDKYPNGFKTNAPPINERWSAFYSLSVRRRKFVSIEPIMNFNLMPLIEMIRAIDPEFVSIGGDSKGNSLIEPSWEKVESLILELDKFTEIRQKKNLDRLKR